MLEAVFQGHAVAQPAVGNAVAPQKKLIVGVLEDPPYLIREKDGDWSGLNVIIWRHVAAELKLTYELKEMTFHELISALQNKTIDVSIEAFFVLAARQNLIDYSFTFGKTRLGVATLPGKAQHPWLAAIKLIFSWSTLKVLLVLFLSLVTLGFIFWLIERKQNPDHFGGDPLTGIGTGIYWVGATLASGVCFGVMLKSLPARILGLIWMLICTLALSALIASLSTAMAENRASVESIDFETLRQMRLGGVQDSAETTVLKELGGRYKLYPDEESAMRAVISGEVDGYLYDEITLRYYAENDYKQKITVSPTNFRPYQFGFGLPVDSHLRRAVNHAIISLMEKPDWPYILQRYGLGENFEVRQPMTKKIR
jgi:ABC-type amino acid transport substrate-binding protein